MNPQCQAYQAMIPDLLSGFLAPQGSSELRCHLEDCSACRGYLEKLRADDELLTGFTNGLRPAVDRIQEAVIGSLGSPSQERDRRIVPVEAAVQNKRFRFVVAAAIALVSLGILGRVWGPLVMPTPTLAQTLAAMQARPWVHSVTQLHSPEGTTVYEDWQRFGVHIRARKGPGGSIEYLNFPENTAYQYNPNSNRITISFVTDSYMVPGPKTAFEMVSEAVELTQQDGGTVTRQSVTEHGRRLELIRLTSLGDPYPKSIVLVRDVEQNLLVRMEGEVREKGETPFTVTFDYPDPGPADIYALGVPRDAIVLDLRPEGPAMALVARVQERYERGLPDHLAVILESEVGQDGTLSPLTISILRQKGGLKRADHYRASDSGGDPRGWGTLYPRIKEDWPNLTIPQVLAMETDEALEWRMFFDGRRTVRYLRDQDKLVKDERPMIDEFIASPSVPYVHSLAGLIWPNLHLKLQVGSSRLKREVRLLADDPNRPGLVGLQFIRFAETEDYWFDPARDDMMVERTHRQEGIGVTSDVVSQSSRTPSGQWYPTVVLHTARTDSAPGTAATTRHYETHVLVDLHPKIDETIFAPTPGAPQEKAATDPNTKATSTL